jgi:hypothetical protein
MQWPRATDSLEFRRRFCLVWRGQETCAREISGGIVYVGGRAGSALASHSASLSRAVGRLQTYGKIGCGRRRIRGRLFHRRKEHPSHKALQRYGWAGKAASLGDMGVSDSGTKSWGEFELWRAWCGRGVKSSTNQRVHNPWPSCHFNLKLQ